MSRNDLCHDRSQTMHVIALAAILLLLAVVLGMLGAHPLKSVLEAGGHVETWKTAVLYQFVHGLAVLMIGIWRALDARVSRSSGLKASLVLWVSGIVAFSGSLYALALGAPSWVGPITPIGGLCFLAGWTTLAATALKLGRAARVEGPSA